MAVRSFARAAFLATREYDEAATAAAVGVCDAREISGYGTLQHPERPPSCISEVNSVAIPARFFTDCAINSPLICSSTRLPTFAPRAPQ